ncbi:hypothetical protein Dimus_036230, partial [Dionaea muscipula]
ALFELKNPNSELKSDLKDLFINSAVACGLLTSQQWCLRSLHSLPWWSNCGLLNGAYGLLDNYVPPAVREERKERKLSDQLENKGFIKPIFGRRPTYIPKNRLDALCLPLLLNGDPSSRRLLAQRKKQKNKKKKNGGGEGKKRDEGWLRV